jgi:hypothetical protein
VFWGWIFSALVESIFISVLPLYTLTNSDPRTGNMESFLEAGMTAFTVIVLVVNFKVRETFFVYISQSSTLLFLWLFESKLN